MSAPGYVRILLEPYANHPVIGVDVEALLRGRADVGPTFGRLAHPTAAGRLSSGEQATVNLAMALWNGNQEAKVADLFLMDEAHQQRAVDAITAKFIYGSED